MLLASMRCGWCAAELPERARQVTRRARLDDPPLKFALGGVLPLRLAGCDVHARPVPEPSGPGGFFVEFVLCGDDCLTAIDAALCVSPLTGVEPGDAPQTIN